MDKFEIELLDPLFYNSTLDSGAAGANTTYPWIGDIALDYAINSALGIIKTQFKYKSHKPNYQEIKQFGFIASMGYPETNPKKTRVYDFATSFISDGYVDAKVLTKVGRSPFRNWIKRQGLAPGSKFYFYILYADESIKFPDTFTIRLGNMKSCIAVCKRIQPSSQDSIWVNLFSVNLFNKVNIDSVNKGNIQYFSARYVIKTNTSIDQWKSMLPGYR